MQARDKPKTVEGSHGCAALTENTLREELRDKLDLHGVPGELIEGWAACEAQATLVLTGKQQVSLPTQVREVSLRFLHSLTDLVGLPQSGWLDASLLLDVYHLSLPVGDLCLRSLPAACVAIVGLLKKSGCATTAFKPAGFTGVASHFLRWLGDRGYADGASVTADEVSTQERAVLRALGWRVNRPSVLAWMKVLCERFDIMSNGNFTVYLEWVYKQSVPIAGTLVMRHLPSGSMAPRCMANGLFCLLMASARLVSASDLRPEVVDSQKWEELFCQSQCSDTMPKPFVPPAHWAEMVNLLGMAARCEISALQADAHAVAEAMLSAAKETSQVLSE